MARPINNGLNYFPLDVDFFEEPKVLLSEEEHGIEGGYIALRLLCWIYREGYYIDWNQDMAAIFARRVGHNMTSSTVNNVVETLVNRGIFNKNLFEKYHILTSHGIQIRWIKIIKDAKRKANIEVNYDLLGAVNSTDSALVPEIKEETTPIRELTKPIKELTASITELSTQSKVKKRKEKEINKEKGRNGKGGKPVLFSPPSVQEITDLVTGKYECSRQAAKIFAERFFEYYEGKEWMVGTGKESEKMKSWVSAIAGRWKETLSQIMDDYPKNMEIDDSLPPEVKQERVFRMSQFENALHGSPHLAGKRIQFSEILSQYHMPFGFFDELKQQ